MEEESKTNLQAKILYLPLVYTGLLSIWSFANPNIIGFVVLSYLFLFGVIFSLKQILSDQPVKFGTWGLLGIYTLFYFVWIILTLRDFSIETPVSITEAVLKFLIGPTAFLYVRFKKPWLSWVLVTLAIFTPIIASIHIVLFPTRPLDF